MKTTLYDSAPEKANDRPDLPEGRPDQEMRTYRFLAKAGITFKRADHDRAETMEDCQQIEKVLKRSRNRSDRQDFHLARKNICGSI